MDAGYTHFVCPLCGRSVTLRSIMNLNGHAQGVMLQRFRGLGRRRGFAVDRRQLLSDPSHPVVRSVVARLLNLTASLAQDGLLSADELIEELERAGVLTYVLDEVFAREALLEDLEQVVDETLELLGVREQVSGDVRTRLELKLKMIRDEVLAWKGIEELDWNGFK